MHHTLHPADGTTTDASDRTPLSAETESIALPQPTAFQRFARAAAQRNSVRAPGPVVAFGAALDVVFGHPPEPERRADPTTGPASVEEQRDAAELLPRSLRGVRLVVGAAIAVAVCAGTFGRAEPSPEAGTRSVSARASSVTPLAVLHSAVDQSMVTERAARDSSAARRAEPTGAAAGLTASPVRLSTMAPQAPLANRIRHGGAPRLRRPPVPPGLPVGVPVAGRVSSPFGWRHHPVLGGRRHHDGTDFAVPVGTPVHVTAEGRVVSAGHCSGYGLAVEVAHRDPAGLETRTLYAHLSAALARAGQTVRRGDVVGLSGGIGPGAGLSTGPHLHYEVRSVVGGGGRADAIDPASLAGRIAAWHGESLRLAQSVQARSVESTRTLQPRTTGR